MEEQELFKELGMNVNEGKVYYELVRHGKLSAADVSSKAQVPYGKIYVVLQGLIDKGFVRVVPERTKKYSPADPKNLEKVIKKKRELMDEAEKKVLELKQFYDDKTKEFLVIGEGDKGFWKIAEDMITPKKYGYNIKWDSKIRPNALERTKKKVKAGKVEMKNLVRYDEETKKNIDKWMKTGFPQAKFPNEGIALSILDDEEVMIGLIKKNTTLLIRDSAFAKVMKRLFLATYEKAEKLKFA